MRLLRNFLFLAGAEFTTKIMTFAAFAYLARKLGPNGFGYIEFAGAVLLCAGLIVDQGFGNYGAREIAKTPERTGELAGEIIAGRLALAVVAYIGVVALALFSDRPPIVARLLLIYGLSLLAMPLLMQWVFQGHDQMRTVAAVQVLRQSVFALIVFAFVRDVSTIWIVAAAEVAGVFCASAYGLLIYRRRFGKPVRSRPIVSGRLIREGVPIGLSQMFWVAKMFGATVILGLIASAEDLGYFAAAMRILIALHAFVWLYYFNLLPSMARGWQQDRGQFALLVNTSFHRLAWIGAAVTMIWVLLAPLVVRSAYGPAFSPAGSTLQWLAGVCVIAGISGHYRFGLIAAGLQTIEMLAQGLGAALTFILIPIGYSNAGPKGAAMALLAAEVVVWLSTWWCGRRMLELKGHLKPVARAFAAAALVAGLLWWLPTRSLGLRTLVVASSILLLSVMLDGVVRDHLRSVQFPLRRRAAQLSTKSLPEVT